MDRDGVISMGDFDSRVSAEACPKCGRKRISGSDSSICPFCGSYYEPGKVRIVLHPNGAEGAFPQPIKAEPGESFILPDVNLFRRSGDWAIGWNTAPDGSGVSCRPGSAIRALQVDTTIYVEWAHGASRQKAEHYEAGDSLIECSVCHHWFDFNRYEECPQCQGDISRAYSPTNSPNKGRTTFMEDVLDGRYRSRTPHKWVEYRHHGVKYVTPYSWDYSIEHDDEWEIYWHYANSRFEDVGFAEHRALSLDDVDAGGWTIDHLKDCSERRIAEIDHCLVLSRRTTLCCGHLSYEMTYIVSEPEQGDMRWISRAVVIEGRLTVFTAWCSEDDLPGCWDDIRIILESIASYC